jgi:acetyl-CoA carboxylase biotin carboxylase subunit
MFKKILVANRGEIARRIMATCREMGIRTVAVYSDADRLSAHVLSADEAVHIGGAEPSASYLNIDAIISAVKETGADAIHPGYGFLSENGDFAERCERENITFIGPPSRVIRSLGDKITARKIMEKGGVPIAPGMTRPCIDMDEMKREAEKAGYPILIKASAGGGGKGIRVVHRPEELESSFASAVREAEAAFGDGSVYMEKYFETVRHVEIQILADSHGNVVHVLERECSVQRRHQKIIEESPSPVVTPSLRTRMGYAAIAAARAAGYVNAGTVEFLLTPDNSFYFLEVNARLQVEHPVTEMITGIDMVRKQIEIAAGLTLDLRQEEIQGHGHAIECRIYAEDPENDFFPSPGTITYLKEPAGPGIRNDCGVYSGVEVPVYYDPIISKLVVHAETREQAIERMVKALSEYVILGVKTPIPFMIDVLKTEAFKRGDVYTHFIKTHFPDWKPGEGAGAGDGSVNSDLALISWVMDELTAKKKDTVSTGEARIPTPWETLGHWRMG